MKLKALLLAVVAALVAVSIAVAAPTGKPATTPPTGKGKPSTTGPTCKPKVTVVLKGTFTSLSGNVLTMAVTNGNRWASTWVKAGTATVTVDPSTTKVRIDQRNGVKTLANLVSGDWLLVQARACKADLEAASPPSLTAARIVAHQAKA
jgi:hypothetical protein